MDRAIADNRLSKVERIRRVADESKRRGDVEGFYHLRAIAAGYEVDVMRALREQARR